MGVLAPRGQAPESCPRPDPAAGAHEELHHPVVLGLQIPRARLVGRSASGGPARCSSPVMTLNTNDEETMRKYAVALEPATVARMREESRRVAAREGRDLTWVGLLREVVDGFLAGVGRDEPIAGAANGGGR